MRGAPSSPDSCAAPLGSEPGPICTTRCAGRACATPCRSGACGGGPGDPHRGVARGAAALGCPRLRLGIHRRVESDTTPATVPGRGVGQRAARLRLRFQLRGGVLGRREEPGGTGLVGDAGVICWLRGHRWRELERFYTPPQPHCSAWVSNREERFCATGFTTVRERCERCGETRTHDIQGTSVLGRPVDEVERLLAPPTRPEGT